jgi:hypothetical protein
LAPAIRRIAERLSSAQGEAEVVSSAARAAAPMMTLAASAKHKGLQISSIAPI